MEIASDEAVARAIAIVALACVFAVAGAGAVLGLRIGLVPRRLTWVVVTLWAPVVALGYQARDLWDRAARVELDGGRDGGPARSEAAGGPGPGGADVAPGPGGWRLVNVFGATIRQGTTDGVAGVRVDPSADPSSGEDHDGALLIELSPAGVVRTLPAADPAETAAALRRILSAEP